MGFYRNRVYESAGEKMGFLIPQTQENIAGYMVDNRDVNACVSDIVKRVQHTEKNSLCRWLACMNPHSYTESLKDKQFAHALKQADWLIPDGSGVVIASRILNGHIKQRVTGSDIFECVSAAMNRIEGTRVFFLGSTEETLRKIKLRMATDYPNVTVVGTYSPPFKPTYSNEELSEMVALINSTSPDVLWVGMTAPKQEKWLFDQRDRLDVKFAAAIGAVFDFYTGNVKRSHPIFQKMGLEWLPRLIQQPRRLWRRMGVSAPIFLWHVLRQRFGTSER